MQHCSWGWFHINERVDRKIGVLMKTYTVFNSIILSQTFMSLVKLHRNNKRHYFFFFYWQQLRPLVSYCLTITVMNLHVKAVWTHYKLVEVRDDLPRGGHVTFPAVQTFSGFVHPLRHRCGVTTIPVEGILSIIHSFSFTAVVYLHFFVLLI